MIALKKVLSAVLTAALLVSTVPAAFAASDIDGHWAKSYITELHENGIINPSANTGNYGPDDKVTRWEFMRYINRAFGFTEKADISFSDVNSSDVFYETVQIAVKQGYINGVGNNRMAPDVQIALDIRIGQRARYGNRNVFGIALERSLRIHVAVLIQRGAHIAVQHFGDFASAERALRLKGTVCVAVDITLLDRFRNVGFAVIAQLGPIREHIQRRQISRRRKRRISATRDETTTAS